MIVSRLAEGAAPLEICRAMSHCAAASPFAEALADFNSFLFKKSSNAVKFRRSDLVSLIDRLQRCLRDRETLAAVWQTISRLGTDLVMLARQIWARGRAGFKSITKSKEVTAVKADARNLWRRTHPSKDGKPDAAKKEGQKQGDDL
jgi:hypothetical protein